MRYFGLDLGDITLGVAYADNLGIVHPLKTLTFHKKRYEEIMDSLYTLYSEYQVDELVVGLPLNMDNTKGDRVKYVSNFISMLNKRYPEIVIHSEDERLTTFEAYQMIDEGDMHFKSEKEKKEYSDQLAACQILSSYLRRIENEKGNHE
ncbi:MAG: Holliday junction resolvase RuvX [Coprobacillus sp.]|nr:Holliday junction resolvase RuvX [Coprobacillus sp.]